MIISCIKRKLKKIVKNERKMLLRKIKRNILNFSEEKQCEENTNSCFDI